MHPVPSDQIMFGSWRPMKLRLNPSPNQGFNPKIRVLNNTMKTMQESTDVTLSMDCADRIILYWNRIKMRCIAIVTTKKMLTLSR